MFRKLPLRYLATAIALLALLLGAGGGAAAPLTGGNTVYVINGEETSFSFDPINFKDGLLLPADVVEALGLSVSLSGKTITLTRQDLQAQLTLGATTGTIGQDRLTVSPAPLRLSGRLFLPASLLPEFGYEVSADGAYLQIRDLTRDIRLDGGLDKAGYDSLRTRLSLTSYARSDDQRANVSLEVTFLTPEMVASAHFPASFKQRVQYLNLLQNHSLLLVTAANQSGRSATLNPAALLLVDTASGKQYDLQQTLDFRGLISAKIASGASKSSILVYPRVDPGVASLTVFVDTNPGSIGTLAIK